MRRERCQAPALDADKRARLCGEPATTERDVPTGYGDETARLAFCDRHAQEVDHDTAPAKRARETLLYYFNLSLPKYAPAEHAAAIRGIVDDIIDAAVMAVRADTSARGGS